MKRILIVIVIALSNEILAQNAIQTGTILPVQLNSSLRSEKANPGQRISGRIMQDVPLPGGRKIHAGSKVIGQIVSAEAIKAGQPSEITFRFDTLKFNHHTFPLNSDLRALASKREVGDAQIPPAGADRGTPWAWATRNLIGGEVAYGEGPVIRGSDIVGKALEDGVLLPIKPNRSAGCRGEAGNDEKAQALWVFSSDACGLYGLPNLALKHAGRSVPVGQITLLSKQGNVKVSAGSGMLLRVNAAQR